MAKKKVDEATRRNNQVVSTNRKARHNYSILETFEAGIALMGTEVKSLRDGTASLADAFATVDDGEIWLRNLHIPEFSHGQLDQPRAAAQPQTADAPPPDRHAHRQIA